MCKKVAAKTWKGCDKKDVKSKGGGQGLCRNAVDHINNFDNDYNSWAHLEVWTCETSVTVATLRNCGQATYSIIVAGMILTVVYTYHQVKH